MDGLGYIEERKHLRVDIDGEVFWRKDGSGRVLEVSSGGVGVADPEPRLPVGTKVHVTLVIGDERIASIPAEVVWARNERLGLCFQAQSPELQGQIDALIRELAEAADGPLGEIE